MMTIHLTKEMCQCLTSKQEHNKELPPIWREMFNVQGDKSTLHVIEPVIALTNHLLSVIKCWQNNCLLLSIIKSLQNIFPGLGISFSLQDIHTFARSLTCQISLNIFFKNVLKCSSREDGSAFKIFQMFECSSRGWFCLDKVGSAFSIVLGWVTLGRQMSYTRTWSRSPDARLQMSLLRSALSCLIHS